MQLFKVIQKQEREAKKSRKEEKAAARAAAKAEKKKKPSNTISQMASPILKKSRRDTRLQDEVQLAVQYAALKGKVVADISRLR